MVGMENILFLTQKCTHCFSLLTFIHQNDFVDKINASGTEIRFFKKTDENDKKLMEEALDILAEERQDPRLASQTQATPMLIEREDGKIKKIHLGIGTIIEYLTNS